MSKRAEHVILIKRVYEPASKSDGRRFLIERLWPRGLKKAELQMDAWQKEVAPSASLRQWFGHQLQRWSEFRHRYEVELDNNPASWQPLIDAAKEGTVTLLYSARDVEHNGAVVLRDYLQSKLHRSH